ncbi:MAG: hypothetical protein MUE42_12230 [Opitutaceae bacterium]|jgi:hypothetical protein|nr:hypothetical protein [Opitutaceae bacterium]
MIKRRLKKLFSLCLAACWPALLQAEGSVVDIQDLLKPHHVLSDFTVTVPASAKHSLSGSGKLQVSGRLRDGSASITLRPESGSWDISKYSYFRVDITNGGDSLIWVRGRLDNAEALDWANSCSSMAYILPGERATLAFPFPRPDEANDSPKIFHRQDGIPNGFRRHWMKFDPKDVRACHLRIRSASDKLNLKDIQVSLAFPYGAEVNAKLMELPYLDGFGQVRQLDWPNKLHSEAELSRRVIDETKRFQASPGPASFNRFGGWKSGPQLKATGFFRVEKYKGRWWLVDPEGRLFFSHGANSVGFSQRTPHKGRETLFEWMPSSATMPGDITAESIQFMIANVHRTYGPDWQAKAYDRVHARLRNWGMNTVGAWSDVYLHENPKTPYTPILHVPRGKHRLVSGITDPFCPDFEKSIEDGLRQLVPNPRDPWCLGVFIDNELVWYVDFVHQVLAAKPDSPARQAVFGFLKDKYSNIGALNQAWATSYASWETLDAFPKNSEGFEVDLKALKLLIGNRYYEGCQNAMRRVLPNHLYLGSRIHKAPPEIYEASTRYADVLSVNRYMPFAVTHLPKNFDKPCIVSEFHFVAPDRGLPGIGLTYVGDQLQRSRAYAAYVVDSVLQPNIVGTHWFAYADQSATGKISRGKPAVNGGIGLVDVTDTPYPEITAYSRGVANIMYGLADRESADLLRVLEEAWRTQPPVGPRK